jgi:signal transduction histidine kinase
LVAGNLPSGATDGDISLVTGGLIRLAFSVLLAVLVVAVQWGFFRGTRNKQGVQSMTAYVAMIAVGAFTAATVLVAVALFGGNGLLVPLYLGGFAHYFLLLVIVHTSIGVIGSQMSTSAARAEDALAKLSTQERRFVASEERARRIAAEFLHDRVQADLLVIAIELRRVGESAPPEIASQIASITEVVESVRVSEVRDTSRMLSPMVQSTGLSSALTMLAQRWRDAMQVSLDIDPDIASEPSNEQVSIAESGDPDRALGIYRIIEQALLNAAAHGQARQVQVSVSRRSRDGVDGIRVHVSDDGVGFEPGDVVDGGGFAISEVWARLLGGDWSVHSSVGQGATVVAWLPTVNAP